jgi:hypothetical protein
MYPEKLPIKCYLSLPGQVPVSVVTAMSVPYSKTTEWAVKISGKQ